ncbi:transferase family protein [Cladorrhinum sp. PSN259]|nr:transferase family protein [Cladorrhinum sp. PSN259]
MPLPLPPAITIIKTERIFPSEPLTSPRAVPLSLLDATTAEFALTSCVWLFNPPSVPYNIQNFQDLASHLKHSLSETLISYPQWCGTCKPSAGASPNSTARHHTDRFGRIHVYFGLPSDPGVGYVTAVSPTCLEDLHPANRTDWTPIWSNNKQHGDWGSLPDLSAFSPQTTVSSPLNPNDKRQPLLAIQLTSLSCGGLILGIKAAHPMADIASLVHFVKTWGAISRGGLDRIPTPSLLPGLPIFDPSALDACAAGDINADQPDLTIVKKAKELLMHRYDWWHPDSIKGCPWPTSGVPDGFNFEDEKETMNKPVPWGEWDVSCAVERCVIHFTAKEIEMLWENAKMNSEVEVSKHDALVAHIWFCITRGRNFKPSDSELLHCNLVIGARRALGLPDHFQGSPIVMVNTALPASLVCQSEERHKVAQEIRATISRVNNKEALSNHLHGLAFEKSPQRIWQAFLGLKHVLVTSWVRSGIYEVDFGFGGGIRYAEAIVPALDGQVVIKEGPPPVASIGLRDQDTVDGDAKGQESWTKYGVDVLVNLDAASLRAFVMDPLLKPHTRLVNQVGS